MIVTSSKTTSGAIAHLKTSFGTDAHKATALDSLENCEVRVETRSVAYPAAKHGQVVRSASVDCGRVDSLRLFQSLKLLC